MKADIRPSRSITSGTALETVNEDLLCAYETAGEPQLRIYEPNTVSVVVGPSSRCLADVHHDTLETDSVPLLKRLGGGGTAVLSPGMVVMALVIETASCFRNREYARAVNRWVAAGLNKLGVRGIRAEGIADLAVNSQKILGSSVYRRKKIFFYQSALLVSNDLSLFTRYLPHPTLSPDYRAGREHEAFCTNLRLLGYRLSVRQISQAMENTVREQWRKPLL